MSKLAGKELGTALINAVRGYVARSIAPIVAEVKAIQQQIKAIKPEKGDKGDRGDQGIQGVPGPQGRDALELAVLPAIDEQRSYPRGTYARHRGGFWRAFEDTMGMRGWECVAVGLHEVAIDLVDERRFVLSVTPSAGEPVKKEFVLPIVIDRGVYRPEQKYAKGDGVTFGGSYWIALKDEPSQKPGVVPPGEQPEWRLTVKRGRDGKDARP